MPSTQNPPLAGAALDPTSVRPPIDDATIERVAPAQLRERLEAPQSRGIYDAARSRRRRLSGAPAALRRRLSSFEIAAQAGRPSPRSERRTRFRLLCGVDEGQRRPHRPWASWKSADWAEREVYDLFGIVFDGHADLRRIQMPLDWEGHPLRKDYPTARSGARTFAAAGLRRQDQRRCRYAPFGPYAGSVARRSEASARVVTLSVNPAMPEVVSQSENTMVLSMGPQHPSTHGVLQIVLEIDSENVVKADPEIGYLHTGIEKTAEGLFLDAGADRARAHGLSRAVFQRAVLRAGRREAAGHHRSHSAARTSRARVCRWNSRASPRTAFG